jgi:hypothetical protein
MIQRVILGILSILSVFFLPWWIVFLICLALLFYCNRFYEVILIAIIADVLYGSIVTLGWPYSITLVAIIVFFLVSKFKRNLIAY